MDFVSEIMISALQNDGFCIRNDDFALTMMDFVSKMMIFALQMMDCVSQMMICALTMMDFVSKMMNLWKVYRIWACITSRMRRRTSLPRHRG